VLTINHRTTYRYARPVAFGEHRLMFRPRDSHDLRLIETRLAIRPAAQVRWLHDVFGNSIAIAAFADKGSELSFESMIRAQHFPMTPQALVLEPYARQYPFSYAASDVPDLGRTAERHYPDPDHRVDLWARRFVEAAGPHPHTLEILTRMAEAVKPEFRYVRREEAGTQAPSETLAKGEGSCRDFALLMMEAARALGFAARFVTGYLYDEALIGGGEGTTVGGGETHAWMQVYLPGAGWVEFDPTNALIGGRNVIRVAVTRDPSQAAPLAGSFSGDPSDFLGMEVAVTVTAEPA
jgi:transglutaminase-like putative cysteine protease